MQRNGEEGFPGRERREDGRKRKAWQEVKRREGQ